MLSLIEQIQGEDPSYDPVALACEASGVDRELFAAALDRVYVDGFHGPVSATDWREQDGREPSSVSEALAVLERVSDAADDYRETFQGVDEDGDEVEWQEITAEAWRRSSRTAKASDAPMWIRSMRQNALAFLQCEADLIHDVPRGHGVPGKNHDQVAASASGRTRYQVLAYTASGKGLRHVPFAVESVTCLSV